MNPSRKARQNPVLADEATRQRLIALGDPAARHGPFRPRTHDEVARLAVTDKTGHQNGHIWPSMIERTFAAVTLRRGAGPGDQRALMPR